MLYIKYSCKVNYQVLQEKQGTLKIFSEMSIKFELELTVQEAICNSFLFKTLFWVPISIKGNEINRLFLRLQHMGLNTYGTDYLQ